MVGRGIIISAKLKNAPDIVSLRKLKGPSRIPVKRRTRIMIPEYFSITWSFDVTVLGKNA
jgi:hypothetical protein